MNQVVIIEDDRQMRRMLQILADELELEAKAFDSAEPALEFLREHEVGLVITDLEMPRMTGIEFMEALREFDATVPVIVLTAFGTVETAVEAMKLGAVDYLAKPFDVDALEELVKRALQLSRYRVENHFLREQVSRRRGFHDMLGNSVAMQSVFSLLERVAPTKSSLLIRGETGTGKELVARAVHARSPRAERLFVPLNCTAIPADLLESELFGHVKGAFTGAQSDRVGKFQAAHGGTLFLDEIGDMDLGLQAKLLRVLQEGVIEPIGSNRQVKVDVRIVSATHRDLDAEVQAGRFREDLYFRLNVFTVDVPALRERPGDLPLLAEAFLEEFGAELNKGPLKLEEGAAAVLEGYEWPGNVRELRNVMERAAVLAEACEIGRASLRSLLPRRVEPAAEVEDASPDLRLNPILDAVERKTILRALAETGDNKAAAAALLEIGERTLWTKLRKHDL